MTKSIDNEQTNPADNKNKSVDNLVENITGLIDTYVAMARLEINNGLALTITYVILISVLLFFFMFVLFFLSLGVAVVINSLSGISFLGYFIVALVYLFMLILIFAQRKNIKAQIDMAISERTKK